jgi:uncharacterized protein involved in type VI secretion and phage assembly
VSTEEQLADVLDRLRHRYYGKYRGSVSDVDEDTWRIKAKVPSVLADQDSGWCMPCVPYAGDQVGFVFLPEVGSGVWIEFEGGDVSFPIWTGCYWRADEKPSDGGPKIKAIVTKASHKLLLDDDAETITLRDHNNNQVTLDSSGITAERGGNKIAIGTASVSINDGGIEVT